MQSLVKKMHEYSKYISPQNVYNRHNELGGNVMKIIHTNLASVIEPLKAPFGFKGRYGVELTQVIARIESEKNVGVGVSIQSVLWSDSTIFKTASRCAAESYMLLATEYGLKLLENTEFETPIDAMDYITDKVYEYTKIITNRPDLSKTFVLNALVCVDNALWQLYGREQGTTDLLSLIGEEYRKGLSEKQDRLSNIPLITYGVSIEDIKALAVEGYACLKIKIGSDPEKDGSCEKMLAWDKNRLKEIHEALKDVSTPYTESGFVMYYLDANGRYDTKERLVELLDYAKEIGAFERILILEEPFAEENKIDVSDLGVRIAADESAHAPENVEERIALGYRAIALKPVAKTMSVSLKMLKVAEENGIPCFCADLTVNPVTREFNKYFASRMKVFPGMKIGMLESNGAQNYANWQTMLSYHPQYKTNKLIEPQNGMFLLDEEFYRTSGGIFETSEYYDRITR